MMSVDGFLEKAKGSAKVFNNYRIQTDKNITESLTICIPDMHLLERGPNDDFLDGKPGNEERFMSLLDFLLTLRASEKEGLEIVQLGDMFDLWQAKGHRSLIVEAYPSIIGLVDKIGSVYVVGNHDIDIYNWYKDKEEHFGRKWRHLSKADGKVRALYEHGFQADFANNQDSWTGVIGREISRIVGMMEYIDPDIDVVLGSTWDSIVRTFSQYNVFTPVRNPEGFNFHEYFTFYAGLMKKYNAGETLDHYAAGDIDLSLSVIGHTHTARLVQMPKDNQTFYLMDCGSWVNGGHEIGVIAGKEMAVCQWG
jgi:UDP-2,3-diacylglucosamine pyrophosphatase LpxH